MTKQEQQVIRIVRTTPPGRAGRHPIPETGLERSLCRNGKKNIRVKRET